MTLDHQDDARAAAATASSSHATTTGAPVSGGKAAAWWRRFGPLVTELAVVAVLYSVYSYMRSASPDRVALATSHADWIEKVERALHIDVELSLNELFVANQWLADAASYWYQLAHPMVTTGVLVWLWFKRKAFYGVQRSSLALLMLAGLATYWLYPLSPPRFALDGAVDTMTAHPVLFWGDNVTGLANLYAAMPSLHVGWAVWCALTVFIMNTSKWRYLAWVYPCITTFAVAGTANHYVLDGVAGAIYAVGAWLIVRAVYARFKPRSAQAVSADS